MNRATPGPASRPATPDEPSSSVRKVALCLHAMPQGDREWLLSQLQPGERARLIPLLSELQTLGLPADRALLDEAMGPQAPPSSEEVLRGADARALAAVLREEPAQFVALLLRVEQWPWREGLLRRLEHGTRRLVELALAQNPRRGPALQASLVEVVVRRLARSEVLGNGARAERGFLSLLRWRARR